MGEANERRMHGLGQAISTCLSNYANFNGRARRSEFWWFWLFVVIVQVVVQTLFAVIVGTDSALYSLLAFVLAIVLATRCMRQALDVSTTPERAAGCSCWCLFCVGIIIMIVLGPSRIRSRQPVRSSTRVTTVAVDVSYRFKRSGSSRTRSSAAASIMLKTAPNLSRLP